MACKKALARTCKKNVRKIPDGKKDSRKLLKSRSVNSARCILTGPGGGGGGELTVHVFVFTGRNN